MAQLEDFLQGKPLNGRMERLMKGEEDDEAEGPPPPARTYADGTPITDQERGHLRRMLGSAGWAVLLKLLDTALADQEDAARRASLDRALPKEQKLAAWEIVAANRDARNAIVALAEAEVEKLKTKIPRSARNDKI
jgi:hypothetical protein